MPKYLFQLQRLNVHNQRGKTADVYVSAFSIEIGSHMFGPIGRQIGTHTSRIASGMNIDLSEPGLAADNPPSKVGGWVIGPLEVAPEDTVVIGYGFVNVADSSGVSSGDQVKIETAVVGALAAVGLATAGIGAVAAAIVGGVTAVLGELGGDLLGDSPPKCNGVAFADKITFSGAKLHDEAKASGGTLIITRTSTNPDIPAECGAPSSADITTGVVLIPFESVRFFLGRNHDLSLGIKKALKIRPPISLRSLIEG